MRLIPYGGIHGERHLLLCPDIAERIQASPFRSLPKLKFLASFSTAF